MSQSLEQADTRSDGEDHGRERRDRAGDGPGAEAAPVPVRVEVACGRPAEDRGERDETENRADRRADHAEDPTRGRAPLASGPTVCQDDAEADDGEQTPDGDKADPDPLAHGDDHIGQFGTTQVGDLQVVFVDHLQGFGAGEFAVQRRSGVSDDEADEREDGAEDDVDRPAERRLYTSAYPRLPVSKECSDTLSEPRSEQAGVERTAESVNPPFYDSTGFPTVSLSLWMAELYFLHN